MGRSKFNDSTTVHVLGPVVVDGPAGEVAVRGRQPAAVAAFLAVNNRPVSRDELAALLWGDELSRHWQSALRGVVSKVRSAFVQAGFDPAVVRSDDTMVHIDIADLDSDLALIEGLVDRGEPDEADLIAAGAALKRPFLPHDDSQWGRQLRDRIHRTARRVTHQHVHLLRATDRADQAIVELRAAVIIDPLDEPTHHLLVETLVATGRHVDASEVVEALTTRLLYELGVAPAQATTDLLTQVPADTAHSATRSESSQTRVRATLHPHANEPFVGRKHELDTLHRIWAEVVATQRPQLVTIEGPAGIGKTRLADCFANEVRAEVGHLLWGRNRHSLDRAWGALADAVQRLVTNEPDVIDQLGAHSRGLWPLLPEMESESANHDDASVRTTLIGAFRALLTHLSNELATVWFVDDLQWASPDAISVMESVIDGLQVPVLVIATSRATPPAVSAGLGSLQRVVPTTPLKLSGLSVDEVGELLVDRTTASSLQARTAGLPFFVTEIARQARLADDQLDVGAIPDTIGDWVLRRVHALAPSEAEIIRLASVIGQEVDTAVLAHCSTLDPTQHARSLDTLVASGLLMFGTGDSLQFSHEITRDAIHEGIGAATRMELHQGVGNSIVEQHQRGEMLDHVRLAYHYKQAGPGASTQAFSHAMRAGRASMRAGAWASAAGYYDDARRSTPNLRHRLQATVGVGRARVAEGELALARGHLYDAVETAEQHDLPTIQASATLALVGRAGRGALVEAGHEEQTRLLRSALSALERASTELTPRGLELWSSLERELAVVLLLEDSADERAELLHRSLGRARRIEPTRPRAVARALLGVRYAKLDPLLLSSRIDDAREVLAMPARDVGSEVRLSACSYLHEDLLRQGDWAGAEQVLIQAERLAERYPHSYWTWAIRTWRALWILGTGEADAAEASAHAAAATRPGIAEAGACLAVNLTNIRLQQGRAGEMMPVLAAAVDAYPEIPTYRAVQALCAAESGELELAAEILASFAAHRFTTLPDDPNRLLGLAALAHVAAGLDHKQASEQLLTLLEPFGDQWVLLQCYGGGGAIWGPVCHALARLSSVAERHDDAERFYDAARKMAAPSPPALERIDRHQRARINTQSGSAPGPVATPNEAS